MRSKTFLGTSILLLAAAIVAVLLSPALRGPRPGGRLADVTRSAGIRFDHENGARGKRHMPETVVGGAGWIDHDADGRYDLYLVNGNRHSDRGGEGDVSNRLYRNLGDGTFADVTEEAGVGDRGYGSGLAVGDVDNDGLPDLYVTNYGENVLYRNVGRGRFRDATEEAGVAAGGWSSSAAFLDYDLDGFLDLYVCRYVEYDPARECRRAHLHLYCSPSEFPGMPDILYRNRGDGTFEDISVAAGVAIAGDTEGKSLGVIVLDHDEDGDPDIYVACDQVPNLLFENQGDGTFREVGLLRNVAYSDDGEAQAGMGVDSGDVDLDGRPDIVVTNFSDESNALYLGEAKGTFREASRAFGLAAASLRPLGFGVLLCDFDLDGDLDLFIANGHVQDNIAEIRPNMRFPQPDQLLENVGGERFRDASSAWGNAISRASVSRAAASCDYDEDGDEDIALLVNGGRAVLLRNESPASRWIAFRLRGTRSNRDGYGARLEVRVRSQGKLHSRRLECRSARSYASACDPRVRVGLGGPAATVESVEVRWPSGIAQRLGRLETDRVHEIVEPEDD